MTTLDPASVLFQQIWECLRGSVDILILRNYESLPRHWGNDVDFLISKDALFLATSLCAEVAKANGFRIKTAEKPNDSLTTLYLHSDHHNCRELRLDFFTDLSKGWVEYARVEDVLQSKITYGEYYVPCVTHEAYLLLMKELFMYGRLRSRYASTFKEKYCGVDFSVIYALSDGLISRSTIKRLEADYSRIESVSLIPRPTFTNIFRARKMGRWLIGRLRFFISRLRGFIVGGKYG